MITSYRILAITLVMQILLGGVLSIWISPTLIDYVPISNEQNNLETQSEQFLDQETLYSGIQNQNLLTSPTVGNPITWSKIVLDIGAKAFNPLPINPNNLDTQIETLFGWLVILVKNLFYLLIILELFMLFINKKTS